LRKLFTVAAALPFLWFGLPGRHEAKIDHQVAEGRSSAIKRFAQDHDTDLVSQTSIPAFDVALSAPAEAKAHLDTSAEEMEFAVEKLTAAELKAALEKLSTDTEPKATEMRKLLVRRWSELDPSDAVAWAAQFPESPIRNDVLEQIAIAWINSNPLHCVNWLQGLPDGESKRLATLGAAYEVARVDPLTALSLASELSPGSDRDAVVEHAVSQWASQDLVTAEGWVKQISDPELREQLLAAAAIAAAAGNAPEAASLIATSLASGGTQSRAAVSITQRWAQSAPLDAAAWISQFPEIPARDDAVKNLVVLWVEGDSHATAEWLNSLPNGSFRDSAFTVFADHFPQ